jgi:hypothetical protein
MPKCAVCGDMMPPDFVDEMFPKVYKCHFCERGATTVMEGSVMYEKSTVKEDYASLLKKLYESKKDRITTLGVESAARRNGGKR